MKHEEQLTGRRLVAASPQDDDLQPGEEIRPRRLDDYIGQEQVKQSLRIFIQAARQRGEPLDHVLFHGFPGLGKTTLAYNIANEMGAGIKVTSGPVIERAGDLAAILTSLQAGDVLFIDEIHRLNHVVEEILYPAMEDFQLDLVIGQGQEPDTLYIHGGSMLAASHIQNSLYDGPIEGLTYDYQPVILEKLPKIEDEGSGATLDVEWDGQIAGPLKATAERLSTELGYTGRR